MEPHADRAPRRQVDLRRAPDLASYVADPFGRFHAGAGFLHFFAEPTLCGTLFWDRPDEAAVREFILTLEAELPHRSPPHRAFVDATRLTGIDPVAFQALAEFLGTRARDFGDNTPLQAIV